MAFSLPGRWTLMASSSLRSTTGVDAMLQHSNPVESARRRYFLRPQEPERVHIASARAVATRLVAQDGLLGWSFWGGGLKGEADKVDLRRLPEPVSLPLPLQQLCARQFSRSVTFLAVYTLRPVSPYPTSITGNG